MRGVLNRMVAARVAFDALVALERDQDGDLADQKKLAREMYLIAITTFTVAFVLNLILLFTTDPQGILR